MLQNSWSHKAIPISRKARDRNGVWDTMGGQPTASACRPLDSFNKLSKKEGDKEASSDGSPLDSFKIYGRRRETRRPARPAALLTPLKAMEKGDRQGGHLGRQPRRACRPQPDDPDQLPAWQQRDGMQYGAVETHRLRPPPFR
jgi:hypothetical protein